MSWILSQPVTLELKPVLLIHIYGLNILQIASFFLIMKTFEFIKEFSVWSCHQNIYRFYVLLDNRRRENGIFYF